MQLSEQAFQTPFPPLSLRRLPPFPPPAPRRLRSAAAASIRRAK